MNVFFFFSAFVNQLIKGQIYTDGQKIDIFNERFNLKIRLLLELLL